ncbi:MAG TPA: lipoyl domain-containing protein, partial [Thermodesulfobacteriota bacterium]|nr:lipoyl domain-containing protein [Thermodesulfobacteriota bacterium]
MTVELRVPAVGESITEVQIGDWLVAPGEAVERDAPVVVLETDKATMELPAPVRGRVARVLKRTGERARVGEVIAHLEELPAAAARDGEGRAAPAAAGGGGETRGAPPRVMP